MDAMQSEVKKKDQKVKLEVWQQLYGKSIVTADQLAAVSKSKIDNQDIEEIRKKYSMLINPYYLSLIKKKGDPIWKQCIPDEKELTEEGGEPDPLCEEKGPVPGLTHRYPDRVLLFIANNCFIYCRFCTRKRRVGKPQFRIPRDQIRRGIEYIRAHKEIRDVIISGGDPLTMPDDFVEWVLKELREIPHIEIIRIDTKAPCVMPQRITENFCSMVKKYHPIFLNTHFNHPNELTPESRKACEMLVDAGIPVGNQTVLLRGVNDNPEVMKKLMTGLLTMRVKPYYIYMADLVQGTAHFRTRLETGLDIIRSLRGYTSGLAVPQLVIDAPNGGGKIPILPEYLIGQEGNKLIFKNYKGDIVEYPELIDA
ncbi:MAG TPA: KamA family radical SAM protein [Candidatus Nanoarchaeia archaeon]|nr:KamA family radical SAM protein [Candidatus Nanoarchaeia archaeon]